MLVPLRRRDIEGTTEVQVVFCRLICCHICQCSFTVIEGCSGRTSHVRTVSGTVIAVSKEVQTLFSGVVTVHAVICLWSLGTRSVAASGRSLYFVL